MVYSVQEKMTERRRGLLNLERLPRPFELDHWMKNGKERESRHPWTSCSNLELTIVVFLKLVQWRMEKTSRRGATDPIQCNHSAKSWHGMGKVGMLSRPDSTGPCPGAVVNGFHLLEIAPRRDT